MSKQKAKNIPKSKQPQPVVRKTTRPPGIPILQQLENWFAAHQRIILPVSLVVSFIFSLLLFDVKISYSNDDSLYIEGAFNFSQDIHHAFTENAPLYPLLLSIPVKIWGINVILLKSISIIFTLLHILFLYLAFRNRIPFVILIPALFIVATNSYFQYFASMTFTESLFMFLQALFIYYFFRVYDHVKDKTSLKDTWKQWLLLGFFIFVLSFCKNIALGALIAVALFFVLEKKFLHALYSIIGFVLVRIPFEFVRKLLWGGGGSQFSSQLDILSRKDPYDISKGQEDFSGFVTRYFANFNLYISKRTYQILGFLSPDDVKIRAGLNFLFLVFIAIAAFWILKNRHKLLKFVWIYFFIMMSIMFVALQTRWDQPRMIMVYLPLILIVVFYGIFALVIKKGSFMNFLYIAFVGIVFLSGFFSTMGLSVKNYPIVKKNLAGDKYYGYTADWTNFLKMSEYCADSLPPTSYVASRKAPMSFVYGHGKQFYGIYNVFSTDPDTVMNTFKKNNVTHFILASLRRNPKTNDGYIINTIHRLVQPVIQKYPNQFTLIKQIGETEPAYLYRINY